MKVTANTDGEIILQEVYDGVGFETKDGEELAISMRDGGYEINYQDKWYSLQNGEVSPLNTLKTDVSIHFTIKEQDVKELNKKFDDWIEQNKDNLLFDFSEKTTPRSVLHHCFLPEKDLEAKGLSTEVYDDLLHLTTEYKVCWHGTSPYGLGWDRMFMLENIKKLNGLSIFIGEIKDGVLEEYEKAQELAIECILIP